ncbi:uncharacterized protein LOC113517202 isoform X1 [Galleria mellonella]|uniref:Uncharacterized protein LOC113517202 isoform X1 n=2 Tax=Galleria mellonella TaxID=7137 RepID=A0A6J1WQX1_GALME|nr:uncharacterized protein LOC113517202 isoform X1 [Galleria mellonella]XP_026757580.2 uncharacterized protein LOC113517202 isoform X1 [Galleria mellonella]XP_052750580.1 uncharacterized protein LOC113517202 isoform X1 [Galleria mellonella]
MDFTDKNTSLQGEMESTIDPGISISMIEEEVPTLTAATIVGVTVVVLVIIAVVFLLGVLIDCRQQRLLEKRMGEVKRSKSHRRINTREGDHENIANNMEETGMSVAPAEILRHIP